MGKLLGSVGIVLIVGWHLASLAVGVLMFITEGTLVPFAWVWLFAAWLLGCGILAVGGTWVMWLISPSKEPAS